MVTQTIEWPDILTLVLYFVIVIIVGLVATAKANRGTAKGFFLAGKSMRWYTIAGSIFAANIGAPTFIGVAGSGAASGIAPVFFEWHAIYILILLGWIFVPVYTASGAYTMPEYLKLRFGGVRIRVFYAIIQLILSGLLSISAELYAGTIFVRLILGWDMYAGVIIILIITGVYSIGGGLAALVYTDTLQTFILIIGCTILAGISITQVGGMEGMRLQFPISAANYTVGKQALFGNMSCGFPPSDSFHLFRAPDSAWPWPGMVFGMTVIATYFFCANQTIVQRNLSARTVSDSKLACVVASYLKILPFFLFILPGMASRILFPQEIGCADPDKCRAICNNPSGCTNVAYPFLVLRVMPTGLKGVMLASMMAALMSSLAANFNGCSSIFTMDIYKRIRPRAGDHETVTVGRLVGLAMIGISVLWLPVLEAAQGSQLWNYIQSMTSYITPPWVVVFILGIFWKRTTERGAWYGLVAGSITALCRIGIHFSYGTPNCGENKPDPRPAVFTKVHYLHFALILAGVTLIVTVIVSLLTEPRPERKLRRRTWWTRNSELLPEDDPEDIEEEVPPPTIDEGPQSRGRRVFNTVCGFKKVTELPPTLTKEEKEEELRTSTDIKEDPTWQKICTINAVIVIALGSFVVGFYA